MSRLLVIEDEAPLLQSILKTLRFSGFEVVGALDGAAGVELAKTYQPDLVISDIRMPEMDGYGVLQALRTNPNTATVPLIFLTAKAEREDMRYGMSLGADDYIPKPFTLPELVTAVETRLAKQARYNDLQQRLADLSKSEQLKSDMLLIAAHDLRNPITAIQVTLHVLKRKLGEEYIETSFQELTSIHSAARRMADITSNILSLEHIQKLVKNDLILTVNLNDLVRTCCQDVLGQAHQKGLRLECDVAASSILVPGDSFQLQEAVHNLLGNAIKYTPAQGTVIVHLKQTDKGAILLVEDTGPGIPADEIDRLFQPFYRGQTSEILETEGTGLGLHLVKNIIERHQGRVFVESVYGKGSVFGFFLPLYQPEPELEPVAESVSADNPRGFIFRLIGHIRNL